MFERLKRKIQPLINIYHLIKAVVANIFYGYPSRKIKVIGVTGTDGKTTTTHLIHHLLTHLGKKASVVTSVYAQIGNTVYETGLHTTTPDALFVQKLIKRSVENGDEYFVLETTSHALDQSRVAGIDFDVSVITNITHEHLDYHKTYANYIRAKVKLLLASHISILNKDDEAYPQLMNILTKKNKKIRTYSLITRADYTKNFKEQIKNLTDYNNYNYLAAYSVVSSLGFEDKEIEKALKSFTLPKGRLETVYDKEFKVIIDFAHTPNSIKNVLSSLTPQKDGRLIHVFGSAGLRDAKKRPLMGLESATYADVIILTEEDYRTEDPNRIAKEIAHGFANSEFKIQNENDLNEKSKNVYSIILDRKSAVERAIQLAKKGDIVILTGKSHEKSLSRGTKEYPYSEHNAVKVALKKLSL